MAEMKFLRRASGCSAIEIIRNGNIKRELVIPL
jgi:hypothetical protein